MRRPSRIRRLSVAAIVSLLVFVAVAWIGVRSFRIRSAYELGDHQRILITRGYFQYYACRFTPLPVRLEVDYAGPMAMVPDMPRKAYLGFSFEHRSQNLLTSLFDVDLFWLPLWFPLSLLLIAPALWLIARPAKVPAFPVIADERRA